MASESLTCANKNGNTGSIVNVWPRQATGDNMEFFGDTSRLGILTQTVVPCPLANWILVARLRQCATDDVAFIGNDFVQIKELRDDGYLYDVIRKEGFESRIRNAQIVGSLKEFEDNVESELGSKDTISMHTVEESCQFSNSILPPQFLALQLCSGDLIFIGVLVDEQGTMKWITSRYRIARPAHKLLVGMHFSVDPSTKYLALGCSEGIFTICALNSRNSLTEQYAALSQLQFIKSEFQIFIDGAILKMDFLHPNFSERENVILLVIISFKGQTRMWFYNWVVGIDITKIRSRNKRGYILQNKHKLPLLLIPVVIKVSFMLVYESFMAVYEDLFQGNPAVVEYNIPIQPPLSYFHGRKLPLWVAFVRPPRTPHHRETNDEIYLVREDGFISYIEFDEETEGLISSDHTVAELELSCGTAVACLDIGKVGGDLIIIGGDSCAGGTYILIPRGDIRLCEPFYNWYPARDFVTTNYQEYSSPRVRNSQSLNSSFPRPDQIFTCSGQGKGGVITELRYGLEAKISLHVEFDSTITQSWVFHELADEKCNKFGRILFLLSLSHSSAVIHLDSNGTAITELDDNSTKFDLRYKTLSAAQERNRIIQVTERSVMMIEENAVQIFNARELLCAKQKDGTVEYGKIIHDAAIGDDFVLFTTSIHDFTYVQILELDNSQYEFDGFSAETARRDAKISTLGKFSTHITCLTKCNIGGIRHAILCEWDGEFNKFLFLPFDDEPIRTLKIVCETAESFQMEPIISISIQNLDREHLLLICGSKDGKLFTFELHAGCLSILSSRCDRVGAASVAIIKDEHSIYGHFVICDFCLYTLMPKLTHTTLNKDCINSFEIHRFWLTDAQNPNFIQPEIFSIAGQLIFISDKRNRDFLITTNSHIIITSMCSIPQVVPRHIKLGGTPTRILYSNILKAIVVGVLLEGKSTLMFIDPKTGTDLSQAIDYQTKEPVKFISGLGHLDEIIFKLFEWIYMKNDKEWNFIVLSTSHGRILIISVENRILVRNKVKASTRTNQKSIELGQRSKILFYTRYKFRVPEPDPEPAYSVVGYPDGLLWCAGRKLFCNVLILADKKFKRLAEYELPSPAINLVYEDGIIYALTVSHSLEILRLIKDDCGETKIIRTHGDQVSRPSLNHIIFKPRLGEPIHLISDKSNKVIGLQPTHNKIMDTLETVFEAEVPESILRFRYGKCRPLWDPIWTLSRSMNKNSFSFGRDHRIQSLSNLDRTDILGLTVTGSVFHFMILDFASWRFLRFLHDLAIKSPVVCQLLCRKKMDINPLSCEIISKTTMQINGDILKLCLKSRLFDEILNISVAEQEKSIHNDTDNSPKPNSIFKKLYELLQELHKGCLKEDASYAFYVRQTYVDLEFFLRPVF